MTQELAGRVAVVTGGASGIGRASVHALAQAGAQVVVADVDEARARSVADEVHAAGGTALAVVADVTDDAAVKAMVATAVSTLGGVDLAVNAAGVGGVEAPTHAYAEAAWLRTVDVNLTGVWRCMRHQIPALLARGAQTGRTTAIVNVASVAGLAGFPAHAAYAASKHGVVGLTKTAALEYARRGLRVNAICPGFTDTPMVAQITGADPEREAQLARRLPIGRLGTPAEIAAGVLYLCSDAAAFMIGHALVLDGGIVAG
ncbi:SDR family NAD(P)-dependent oxidoreductase [Roseisolibacter agri]|uniref:Short chain dehydrogenase n=1 Tax=Roseisolibacter agri TaxID=2014610 RepID=A0AA37Q5T6_9BACT|nr:glucose 1-dehydrogenase [Roseisolibacter agri]GLC23491.1 short chain dehydrogenase [Roseisolibacter agri]